MIFLLTLLLSIVSFTLSSVVGGGASLILIPVLSLSLSPSLVPFSLVIGTFTSSLTRTLIYWRFIDWRFVFRFAPSALVATGLGAWLLTYFDPLIVRWFCGLFLIANLRTVFVSKKKVTLASKKRSTLKILLIGLLAGVISGLTGAIGLLLNKFYLNAGLSKERLIATRGANEILLHLVKLIFYYNLGLYSYFSLQLGILVSIGAVLSTYALRYVLPFVTENNFRLVGQYSMIASGLLLLVSSTRTIVEDRDPSVSLVKVVDGVEANINWGKGNNVLEIEYDDWPCVERKIEFKELPERLKSSILLLVKEANNFRLEEVFSVTGHYFELYVQNHKGHVFKYEISSPTSPSPPSQQFFSRHTQPLLNPHLHQTHQLQLLSDVWCC